MLANIDYMKKYLFPCIIILAFVVPTAVFAIDLGGDLAAGAAKQAGFDAGTNETTLSQNIGAVINIALSFVGTIFLILTVYAGFLWMTARGDQGKIEKAQDIIKAAIIGLIITVGAYSITNFVVPRIVDRASGGNSATTSGGVCQTNLDCPNSQICRGQRCINK